ncbi:MAG: DUF4249 family protein [Bacteroidaceae bacterium]|nr:DUF4249 family protein [Bacteroidaceae bacterium]
MNRYIECWKKYSVFVMAAVAVVLSSCKKGLDFDYNEVEPFYVVQGDVSDEPAKVLITKSRNVSDSVRGQGLPGAEVVISDDNGKTERLVYGSDGYYRSPSGWKGETGRTYSLNVKIDGREFKASSTMREEVRLDSVKFVWLTSAGMKMMLLKFWHTYPKAAELSRTHFRMYKNGEFYRSTTGKQVNKDFFSAQSMVGCTTEKKLDENDPEERDALLFENDRIHVELWTIDQSVYDYFFSLQVGRQNASNPITNISGGAFGYFSAHHVNSIDTVFRRQEVKDN